MKYCYICGAENSDAAEKCDKCGKARFALSYSEYLEFKFSGKPLPAEDKKPEEKPFFETAFKPAAEFSVTPEPAPEEVKEEPAAEFAFKADYGASARKADKSPAEEFVISGGTLIDYKGKSEKVFVPFGVTEIDHSAFARNAAIKEVVLPEGLKIIGKRGFFHCDNLSKINLPKSLKRIEDSAFDGCGRLEEIEFPDGLEYIGEMAFVFCAHLKKVQIPATVQRIGSRAFGHCRDLKTAVMPEPLPELGWSVFDEGVKFNRGAEKSTASAAQQGFLIAGGRLLKYTGSEKNVVLPFNVKSLGTRVFANSSVETVVLPEKLYSIDATAFAGCRTLKKITIPASVISIELGAFEGCTALQEVTIESGVTSIGENAFAYCTSLKDIFIPKSVVKIGEKAFYCSGLQQLVCGAKERPSGWNRNWNVARGSAFSKERFVPQWGGKQFLHDGCVVHKD